MNRHSLSVIISFIILFLPILYGSGLSDSARWKGTIKFGMLAGAGGYGIAVDGSGNAYVTGYSYDSVDRHTHQAANNLIVVKYDSFGVKRWSRQLGTVGLEVGKAIAADKSGNIYVTGFTTGGLDGNTNQGEGDIFVVKYDPAGVKQWTQQLGTPADDRGADIAVDESGNVYVTGSTAGGLKGNIKLNRSDLIVVKYNSSGALDWTQQLGTIAGIFGKGIAVDGRGDVYVTGGTRDGLEGYINRGADITVIKYDSSGVMQWTRQLGTPTDDYGDGMAVDGSGNAYVTGSTTGDLDGNTNRGGADIIVVKYDSSGAKQWTRQFGTPAEDGGAGIAVDGSGNVYITGSTMGSLDGNANQGANDIIVVKYDSSGTKQWTRQLGTPTDDFGYDIAVDGSGNVYVTGTTTGGLDGNVNRGLSDLFVVKYNSSGVKQWTRQLETVTQTGGTDIENDQGQVFQSHTANGPGRN